MSFAAALSRALGANHIEPTPTECNFFSELYQLAARWAAKINLTANLSVDRFIAENVLDPLLAYTAMVRHTHGKPLFSGALIDLGCGGGFVGLTWHTLGQGAFNTVLLDADRKKVNFCKQVIRDLGLTGIDALQGRAEDLSRSYPKKFSVATTRATWRVEDFTAIAVDLLTPDGIAIAFESDKQATTPGLPPRHTTIPYTIEPAGIARHLSLYPVR